MTKLPASAAQVAPVVELVDEALEAIRGLESISSNDIERLLNCRTSKAKAEVDRLVANGYVSATEKNERGKRKVLVR